MFHDRYLNLNERLPLNVSSDLLPQQLISTVATKKVQTIHIDSGLAVVC